MKTHTIRRKNDKLNKPILTFTAPFFKLLLEAHPEAMHLTVARLLHEMKRLTGKDHLVEYKQNVILDEIVKRTDKPYVASDAFISFGWEIVRYFREGFMADCNILSPEHALELTNTFYRKADVAFFKPKVDLLAP